MKKTAVEWLEFEINRRGPKENNPPKWLQELYNEAKAMEKKQQGEVWDEAIDEDSIYTTFEQYYNETFNKDKQ